jgi:peptide/nickel transport system permease protein/dipeptide transport system permease protein
MKMILRNRSLVLGLSLVGFFLVLAILSPIIAPFSYDQVSGNLKLPPAWQEGGTHEHFLGTDDLGRDSLSRLLYGAPVSLAIGLFVVLFSVTIGTFLGVIGGSKPGWPDNILSRIMDIIMALPSMLMAIVIVAIVGPSFQNTVFAIGIVSLPAMYRIVRGAVMLEMSKNYVQASKSFGASWWRITFINVLPNCWAPLIVQASLGFSDAILSAAALGFLGLGAQPPTPEWGTMLSDARAYLETSPWLVTLPGLCILLVVMGFNFIGDGLRDWMDPKLRRTL